MRDDFDARTKETLARRVGYRCSNPDCRKLTSGPQEDPTKAVSIGVAAHITAASEGGPRYALSLSPEERRSVENGLWLCQNCAKLIDSDVQRYTPELLRKWKRQAEQRAQNEIGGIGQDVTGADLVLRVAIRGKPQPALRNRWVSLLLDVAITSSNTISSENGALKLTVALPIVFSETTKIVFRPAYFEMSTGLTLRGYDVVPHAQSMMIRWGANSGTVIFPGQWHDFFGNPVFLEVPDPSILPNPIYLFRAELFTVNSPTRSMLCSIQRNAQGNFEVSEVGVEGYDALTESFWATYHLAREKLKG